MDYLQIEKYRIPILIILCVFFFPIWNVFALLQSAHQHSATQTRISPHIADMAGTIKAVLKTFSHKREKTKVKTEKIHKQKKKKKRKKQKKRKNENKIFRGRYYNTSQRMYLFKMDFLLSHDASLLLTIL